MYRGTKKVKGGRVPFLYSLSGGHLSLWGLQEFECMWCAQGYEEGEGGSHGHHPTRLRFKKLNACGVYRGTTKVKGGPQEDLAGGGREVTVGGSKARSPKSCTQMRFAKCAVYPESQTRTILCTCGIQGTIPAVDQALNHSCLLGTFPFTPSFHPLTPWMNRPVEVCC